jgi:hypothetical protein
MIRCTSAPSPKFLGLRPKSVGLFFSKFLQSSIPTGRTKTPPKKTYSHSAQKSRVGDPDNGCSDGGD